MKKIIYCIKLFIQLLFSKSFSVTHTIKKGTTLIHFEHHHNFTIADFDQCFIKYAEILNDQYPDICRIKVIKPPAVPMTTITKAEA